MQDEKILKRVLYRACYRGGKEADRILGSFAKTHATSLSAQELEDLDALLQCDDGDIFAWLEQIEPVPSKFDTPALQILRNYTKLLKA